MAGRSSGLLEGWRAADKLTSVEPRSPLIFPIALSVAFLAAHLPYLPVSLEDLDSINFALGLHDFDVAAHQPHPPGYPVFILLGRVIGLAVRSEVGALSLLSVIAGSVAVLVCARLFLALTPSAASETVPTIGLALTVTAPLFWVTAARPLSDVTGLAAAIAVQGMLLRASTPSSVGFASLVAGASVGLRSQVVWLTGPLMLFTLARHRRERRWRVVVASAVGFGAGVLAWMVPLLLLSGGARGYLTALGSQGAEDFSGVAMLATHPSPRLLLAALYYTFVAPWGNWWIAAVVLVMAVVGLLRCALATRPVLNALLVSFGPYTAFHLLFQETATTRYALPLILPVAYLAATGISVLSKSSSRAVAALVVGASLVTGASTLRAYASAPAPAFRVLEDMQAASVGIDAPVLAMHRRQELDLRRPLQWNRDRLPRWSAHLAAPPKHEWLELVRYWNGGGRAPVWFLADPPRSDLRLVDPRSLVRRGQYRWPFKGTDLIGGVRPDVMDWYEIGLPNWYLGQGWALTPETAGVAKEEQRGPGRAPVEGWVRRRAGPATLMIGGRNFTGGGSPVPLTVALNGRVVLETTVAPGFFLRFVSLDSGALLGDGDVAALSVEAGSDEVSIEQFDIQSAEDVVYGFDDGWQELEYDPQSGRLWRWTSDRATIRAYGPRRNLVLHLDGTFETSARTAHLTLRSAGRVVAETDVERRFSWDVPIPVDAMSDDGETVLTIESSEWYVPAEVNWRPTDDRRRLGLRLFECQLRLAS